MIRRRDGSCLSRAILITALLLLLAVTVYNTRQILALKAEIARLQIEVSALRAGRQPSLSGRLLEDVRTHIERARKYALDGNYKGARTELEKSLRELEKGTRFPNVSLPPAVEEIRKKWDETSKILEKIWSKSAKTRDRKG